MVINKYKNCHYCFAIKKIKTAQRNKQVVGYTALKYVKTDFVNQFHIHKHINTLTKSSWLYIGYTSQYI